MHVGKNIQQNKHNSNNNIFLTSPRFVLNTNLLTRVSSIESLPSTTGLPTIFFNFYKYRHARVVFGEETFFIVLYTPGCGMSTLLAIQRLTSYSNFKHFVTSSFRQLQDKPEFRRTLLLGGDRPFGVVWIVPRQRTIGAATERWHWPAAVERYGAIVTQDGRRCGNTEIRSDDGRRRSLAE